MPKIKLTDADVRGLRYARNVEGASLAFLANAYGVSKAQVSRVTRGLQRRTPEVSSHEETPEVGKWSVDGPPVNRSITTLIYDDLGNLWEEKKAEIAQRWFKSYEELLMEAGRGKNLQEF